MVSHFDSVRYFKAVPLILIFTAHPVFLMTTERNFRISTTCWHPATAAQIVGISTGAT